VSIPQRTCLGCYKITIKSKLIRIVRSNDGSIVSDLHGKKVGRGAYVCRDIDCISKALKIDKLNRAFRITSDSVNQINSDNIYKTMQDLLEDMKRDNH
jgi:predicted RNA-binding protein YlxR (DUF448 family)